MFSHTFPVLCKFTFPIFWELLGFLLHPKHLRNHKSEMFVFPHTFPVLWQSTFSMFLELYGFLLHKKNFKKPLALKYLFSHIFPLIWEFTFPIFWEFYGFLLHPKYLRNPNFGLFGVFPYFSLTMGICFFHILGIVWISASIKIVEKPITLECLFFSNTFPIL